MAYDTTTKEAFGEWLALSKNERVARGMATTKAEFARVLGVSRKTLQRWEDDEVVRKAYKQAVATRNTPNMELSVESGGKIADPSTSAEEFEAIRREMVERAREGDEKAQANYMRYFGQRELEKQRAREESGFADFSDKEIADHVLSLIGLEYVLEWVNREEA